MYLFYVIVATYTRDNRFKVSNHGELGFNYVRVEDYLYKLPQTINVFSFFYFFLFFFYFFIFFFTFFYFIYLFIFCFAFRLK
jgi:hypothetical protein